MKHVDRGAGLRLRSLQAGSGHDHVLTHGVDAEDDVVGELLGAADAHEVTRTVLREERGDGGGHFAGDVVRLAILNEGNGRAGDGGSARISNRAANDGGFERNRDRSGESDENGDENTVAKAPLSDTHRTPSFPSERGWAIATGPVS